jgi:uncharacterized protein (TIGR02996 family)
MTDADPLRRAVLDRPDDDTPRLVYADFLEENGDPDRAAFVRLQVEAARAEPHGPVARAARDAADRLLARHHAAWTRHVPPGVLQAVFDRGFVGHVTLDAVRFAESATVFAAEPVRAVRLLRIGTPADRPSFVPALTSPTLARVARLEIPAAGPSDPWLDADEWDVLVSSPHLSGLRELALPGAPINPGLLAELLGGVRLPNLAALDLNGVTHAGVAVAAGLAKAKHRRFAALNLSGVVFRSVLDLQRLLGAACLKEVRELRLAYLEGSKNSGPLAGMNLGWVLPWRALRVLDVAGHRIGPEGVKEIARCPEARHLRWLGLRNNGFGPEGVSELESSLHLRLYHLDVRGNAIGPDEVAALRKRFPEAVIEHDPPRPVIRGR